MLSDSSNSVQERCSLFLGTDTGTGLCHQRRLRGFPWPDHHDASKFAIAVQIAVKWHVDDDLPSVLRRVHEVNNTPAITTCQPDMLCKTFRAVPADTDDVAVLNFGLDSRDFSLGNVVDRPA